MHSEHLVALHIPLKGDKPLVRLIRTVTFDEGILDLTLLMALLSFSVAQKEVQNGKYL